MESYNATVREDWGSSDWYAVIDSMDKYIDRHGLSPESIKDAARDAAIFWGDAMGHNMDTRDGEEEAIEDCIGGWMRMSKRGQMLQKMFAPVEEEINEGEVTADYELEIESYPDGEVHVMIKVLGTDQVVVEMDMDNWKDLMREFNKYMRRTD